MKVLVTGGIGYIGCQLCKKLLELEEVEQVTVLDNLLYRQTPLIDAFSDPRFTFIYGDVRNIDLLTELVNAHDVIIPLAAIVGMKACDKDQQLAYQVNYEQIKNIAGVIRSEQMLLTACTNSGYGVGEDGIHCTEESPLKPISHYGQTKCAAEEIVLDKNGISLRLATVFGISPRQRLDLLVNDFTYQACQNGYLVLFESHFKRNYIHVKDVVETFVFAIRNFDQMKGQAYNVGLSNANLSKLELAEKIKEQLPKTVIIQNEVGSDPDKRNYIVSNEKLESLGWKPKYSLEEGIAELIKVYPLFQRSRLFTNA